MVYTTAEDQYIYKCATESRTVCHGLTKAAKKLGRTEKAVMYRYYNVIKKNSKKRAYNERVRTEVLTSVQRSAKAKARAKAKAAKADEKFYSEHQKMLNRNVRFTLASLAKDHDQITVTIKGTEVTAVFK